MLDSIQHCQLSQGLNIYAWVLMTNHFHTICNCQEGKGLGAIWRYMKSYTAMKLIDAIINNPKESRRESLLHTFEEAGQKGSSNVQFKFWEHENHPVFLETTEAYDNCLQYTHWNPVTAGFVAEPWHWLQSSATDYFTDRKGRLELVILDGL
ncbi:MAG: transposase [Ferruginibacter sp.]|nr:transposase [Ferruginibacter sp.]